MSIDKCQARLLIADDHALIRDTVSFALEEEGAYQIEHAGSFESAKQKIADCDIALVDIGMPDGNGLSSVIEVIKLAPKTKVLVFSQQASLAFIKSCIENGAVGYVPKSLSLSSFKEVLQFVMSGNVYIPVSMLILEAENSADDKAKQYGLSKRELEVLKTVAGGKINKVVASELNVAEVTVKAHMKSVLSKLGVANRTQAVLRAKDIGMIH